MEKLKAVRYLVDNGIFCLNDIKSPAMEFYIKDLMESYDIGFNNAMRIDSWLYNPDLNEMNLELCTLEITYKDKELIEKCCLQCGLNLSFDKWRTEDFDVYQYEF